VVYVLPNEGSKAPGASGTATPKVPNKYRSEDTTPLSIELTDPPPPEGYKIELQSK
jgi:hypothetical protein